MSEISSFKDEYQAAVRRYNKSTYLTLYITGGFILLSPFSLMFINIGHSSIFFVAENDLTQTGADYQMWLELGLFLLITFIIPVIYLFYYDNRLRRNPTLHCPLCDAFLGMEHISALVSKTGMCPECKEMLFEGEFATKEEAFQYYHQLNVDANQRYKSEMKGISRFTLIVSFLALIPTLLIYTWLKSIIESVGGESMKDAVPSTYGLLVPFLIIPLIFWILEKFSLKECERCDEELKQTAHEMDSLSLKTDSKN